VQDAGNQNALGILSVEDDVPAMFDSAKTRRDIVARAAQSRAVGKPSAAVFETFDVTDGLVFAPPTEGIRADVEQVGLGAAGEPGLGHA